MLKIVKVIIPILLIFTIALIGYNSYKKTFDDILNPIIAIPNDASIIIQCNNTQDLISKINSLEIWRSLNNISKINEITSIINDKDNLYNLNKEFLSNDKLLISFHKSGFEKTDMLFAFNLDKNVLSNEIENIINSANKDISKVSYNDAYIFIINLNNQKIYFSHDKDIGFCSRNKMLVEDAIRNINSNSNLITDEDFNNVYSTLNKSSLINVIFNYNKTIELTNVLTNNKIEIQDFCDWTAVDLTLGNNMLNLSGYSNLKQSPQNTTDLFINQDPSKILISDIIPKNTSILYSISFDNLKKYSERNNKLLQKQNKLWSQNKKIKTLKDSTKVSYDELIKQIKDEAGFFKIPSTQYSHYEYAYFRSENTVVCNSLIQGLIKNTSSYSGYIINNILDRGLTKNILGDLFLENTPYFTIIDDYFIFGKNKKSLIYVIDNFKSKNTLSNNEHYEKFIKKISQKSNIYIYVNPLEFLNYLKNNLQFEHSNNISYDSDSISKISALSFQFKQSNNLILNNINLFYDKEFEKPIKEEWLKQLDTLVNTTPKCVPNHFTNEKIILVQNSANILYSINSNGKILWKKQLESGIIGGVSIIDFYKNNKNQYLFNTSSRLYLIDRNGEDVEDYPHKLKTKTNLQHSLFDYDKNKKYRVLIVGVDNNIYNYDKFHKKVNGWKYELLDENIINSLKHFTVNNRDYIMAYLENRLLMLARNGSVRNNFATNLVYAPQFDGNKFIYSVTKTGKLWKSDFNEMSYEIEIPNLTDSSLLFVNSDEDFKIIYTNGMNTIYFINEQLENIGEIKIKEKISNIKFYKNKLIIISDKKAYLWENDFLKGSPIATDGYLNLDDIDNDGKMNIINIQKGSVYNYEISN